MLFRKKKPVRVEFVLAGHTQVIGYDEVPASALPIDFDFPTQVEIDGRIHTVKATDPNTRAEAQKAGLLTVWVEAVAQPEPAAEELPEDGAGEEAAPAVVAPPAALETFAVASCAGQAPRLSGKRGEYQFVEIMAWQWRQVEFLLRDLAPEIGEEMGAVQAVRDGAAVQIGPSTRYSEQHTRELTQLGLRGFALDDIGVQTRFFPFATRKDGIALMGRDGYVDNGFAYVLPSGIALYGQEFEGKVRHLALCPTSNLHPANLDEDVAALQKCMAELGLLLMDWDLLEAVEADAAGLRGYLEGWMA